MSFSGYFAATSAPSDWQDYPTLARICEAAELTNRQAEVVLLYCARQRTYAEIKTILGIPWKEVWRALKAANTHLRRRFPILGLILERLQSGQDDESFTILQCLRNVVSTGRVPVFIYDDSGRQVTVRARMLTGGDVRRVRLEVVDALEWLLDQEQEEQLLATS
jgi:hypothetical protein